MLRAEGPSARRCPHGFAYRLDDGAVDYDGVQHCLEQGGAIAGSVYGVAAAADFGFVAVRRCHFSRCPRATPIAAKARGGEEQRLVLPPRAL